MLRRHLCVVVVLLLVAVTRIASAQSYPDAPPGQLIGVPVYDPQAKRYFALMHAEAKPWYNQYEKIMLSARSSNFKGVQGRLAIIDSLEVHEFLLKTFHPGRYQYIWIGLRYLCSAKKLEWSDGRLWQPGSFQIWDAKWNQDIYTCNALRDNPDQWAPIAYSPEMHSWIAKGRGKGYDWYFVEFPTGKE